MAEAAAAAAAAAALAAVGDAVGAVFELLLSVLTDPGSSLIPPATVSLPLFLEMLPLGETVVAPPAPPCIPSSELASVVALLSFGYAEGTANASKLSCFLDTSLWMTRIRASVAHISSSRFFSSGESRRLTSGGGPTKKSSSLSEEDEEDEDVLMDEAEDEVAEGESGWRCGLDMCCCCCCWCGW